MRPACKMNMDEQGGRGTGQKQKLEVLSEQTF